MRRKPHAGSQGLRSERALRLLLDVALVLAAEDDHLSAIRHSLRMACHATGWECGQAWVLSANGSRLECAPVWHGALPRHKEFREASLRARFSPGQGLPGLVWSSKRSAWLADVSREGGSPRPDAAVRAGLRAVLGVPVLVDDEVVAVLEFVARGPRPRKAEIAAVVSAVASQVGSFVRRQRTEGALRESEESFRSLLENAADGVVVADTNGRILGWNRSARTMFGRTEREVLGKPLTILMPERYRDAHRAGIRRYLDSGVSQVLGHRLEMHGLRKDGEEFPLELSLFSWESGGKMFLGGFLRDITRRRSAEEGLRSSEARHRSLVESAVFGIYESSVRGRFTGVNRALVEMLGYTSQEELLAVDIRRDLYADPAERDRNLRSHRGSDRVENLEADWKRKDGAVIRVRLNGRPVRDAGGRLRGFQMIVEDVTERRALEARFRETQKLEALGRMAGSVAHDFNNMVTAVIGYCDLLLDRYGARGPEAEAVRQIRIAGEAAASLTAQLLSFGRREAIRPRPVDVDGVLDEMREVLRRLVGDEVDFVVRPGAAPARIESDPGRLQQVLLNLVVNARDAVGNKGTITVETGRVDPEDDGLRGITGLPPIPMVRLTVSDTGHGMDEAVRARLFEPFFTTKEKGKGTGLGLATVHGIVKQGGGEIRVESAPGKGARFHVYLPLLASVSSPSPGPGPSARPRPAR